MRVCTTALRSDSAVCVGPIGAPGAEPRWQNEGCIVQLSVTDQPPAFRLIRRYLLFLFNNGTGYGLMPTKSRFLTLNREVNVCA
jgi:hypothetical protein